MITLTTAQSFTQTFLTVSGVCPGSRMDTLYSNPYEILPAAPIGKRYVPVACNMWMRTFVPGVIQSLMVGCYGAIFQFLPLPTGAFCNANDPYKGGTVSNAWFTLGVQSLDLGGQNYLPDSPIYIMTEADDPVVAGTSITYSFAYYLADY
jgi:hypothetical protein